ncbi:metalloendopeptidase [Streptomyces sp. AJS327]|uniref:peptidoglycan-binding protein n=1 Tax=Streptomyces sp. AJS327 TaxID=2545265 RepID=UPI0015DDA915|nr:peptidoglycan-binding protein [Streptomyces sp. AJS327]MBA0052664.1 metalloendopeptidase [Streptomyces sp. AJS327]
MCEQCGPVDGSVEEPRDLRRGGPSRRKLLIGAGAGLGAALASMPFLASSASAASLKDGRWCNPARGYFPDGGHYGAPRGAGPHAGQDVTNSIGTAVYAAAAGTVIRRGTSVVPGRSGNGIVISHGGGRYTYYGHLNKFRVALNAKVGAGQRIADMGATGNVTGPHLHFEVHTGSIGSTTNPVPYLTARGVKLGGGWSSIDPGAVGATVKSIQYLMTQRGTKLEPDGDYGSVSVNAVKKFQSSKGLVADGQVGPKTWAVLVYTLKKGGSGSHVRALQTVLNKHSAGLALDGDFGSVTDDAVRAYQGANRLVVDGEAGPKTWQALVG